MIAISKSILHKVIVVFLTGALVAGCVTPGGSFGSDANLSSDERQLRQQQAEFDRTVVGGVVAGAIAGALIGALLGRDSKGALVGAGVGATAGGLAGSYVANKKKQHASEQARLASVRADVQKDNQKVAQVISVTERVMARNENELVQMKRLVASGGKRRQDMTALVSKVEANRNALQGTIANLKKRRTEYYQASSSTGNGNTATRAEISVLETQIQDLEGKVEKFNEILNVNRL